MTTIQETQKLEAPEKISFNDLTEGDIVKFRRHWGDTSGVFSHFDTSETVNPSVLGLRRAVLYQSIYETTVKNREPKYYSVLEGDYIEIIRTGRTRVN